MIFLGCCLAYLDERAPSPGVVIKAQVEELLEDGLSSLISLDLAIWVKQDHVACAAVRHIRCMLCRF